MNGATSCRAPCLTHCKEIWIWPAPRPPPVLIKKLLTHPRPSPAKADLVLPSPPRHFSFLAITFIHARKIGQLSHCDHLAPGCGPDSRRTRLGLSLGYC